MLIWKDAIYVFFWQLINLWLTQDQWLTCFIKCISLWTSIFIYVYYSRIVYCFVNLLNVNKHIRLIVVVIKLLRYSLQSLRCTSIRSCVKLFTILSIIKIIVRCKYTIFYWINRQIILFLIKNIEIKENYIFLNILIFLLQIMVSLLVRLILMCLIFRTYCLFS